MLALLLTVALAAASNPELQRAESLFEQLKYADAAKAVQKALTLPKNDRATVLRSYELQGIIDATMGKKSALDSFKKLMSLDPERTLSRDYGPRILGPFYEAKARLDEYPPVKLATTATFTGAAQELRVKVESDSLKLGVQVALFWRSGDGDWSSKVEPVKPEGTTVTVEGDSVDWYVRLYGAYDAVLLDAGSADQPLLARPPPPEPAPSVAAEGVTAPVEPSLPAPRKIAIGLVGAGVVGLALSAGFGLSSQSARNQVTKPIGVPSAERYEALQATAVDHAIAANLFLVAGLAFAGTGVVLWLLGGGSTGGSSEAPPSVALVPTGTGAALVGTLP